MVPFGGSSPFADETLIGPYFFALP